MKKATILKQRDQADCGVACLLSLMEYYGGVSSIENLRQLSGTGTTGTTLLGLMHAARAMGFNAEGCEADLEALKDHPRPLILHVILKGGLQHYMVYFGHHTNKDGSAVFTLGDPARGIITLSEAEVDNIWQSKACLTLEPNADFVLAGENTRKRKTWIISLVREDIGLLLVAAALGLCMAGLGMVMAFFTQRLIDDFLPNAKSEKLFVGIVLVAILLMVKESFGALRQHLLLQQGKAFNSRIITFFFTHLMHLPKTFFDSRKTGDLTARLHDTARIQRVISQLAGSTLIDLLVVVVTVAVLFTYSTTVALCCLAVLPIFFWFVFGARKSIMEGQRGVMQGYALAESNYIASVQGIEAIKNHEKQDLFARKNETIYNEYQNGIVRLGKIQIRLGLLVNLSMVLFLTGILALCSYNVLKGNLTTGQLMAILALSGSLLPAVASIALLSIPISEAGIAFDRMFEFTEATPEKKQATYSNKEPPIRETLAINKVEISGLSFRFAGRSPLLVNLNLVLQKGCIVGLLGESGSGKSTITQIILKHYEPEDGSIFINEIQSLQSIAQDIWRKHCTIVPQQVHIFNGTILENIAFEDSDIQPSKVFEFLQENGFMPYLNQLPHGPMTMVGEDGINLSGGQKQLVGIARALYAGPQVLLLDEATSAMDRDTEQFVLQLLQNWLPNLAIMFITHRLNILHQFTSHICVLQNGTIFQTGTHNQLLANDNLYSRFWSDLSFQK